MTKFIFGLSLMVVVLTIGCFTFPLDESSTSTGSPLVTRSLLPDQETTEFMKLRPVTDGMNFETSTFSLSPMSPKQVYQKPRKFGESESAESFTITTIRPLRAGGFPDSSLTSAEVTTELTHHRRDVPVETEPETETETEGENEKREVLELTTSYMPSFTSTSSAVAPKYYKSESSTQKYVGRLDESSEEGSESPKIKNLPKSKLELTTETNFPTAQLDQKLGDLIKNIPSGIMNLEENTTAVTRTPEKLETTTMKKLNEQSSEEDLKTTLKPKFGRKPESEESLNQGKEPAFTPAPQPDN